MYAPQPLSQAPVANDLEPMEPGSRCFLRRPLQYPGMPRLERGESGIILVVHGSEAIVLFAHGTVTIYDMQCLEPAPGTFSLGFATLTRIPYGLYSKGMMISDSMFPRSDHTQYPRYLSNVQLLLNSGIGVSFYDGISALNILGTFQAHWPRDASAYLRKVGLIVCEHIWP